MKSFAEQLQALMAKKEQLRQAYHASFEKEAKQIAKRLGLSVDDVTYETCFNAYLGEEYPTDKDGNDAPFKRPSKLSKLTVIYLMVDNLPYMREKSRKWVNLINEIEDVKKLFK